MCKSQRRVSFSTLHTLVGLGLPESGDAKKMLGYQHRVPTSEKEGAKIGECRRRLNIENAFGVLIDKAVKLKVSIRAKVKHPFRVIKRQFGSCHAVCAVQTADGTR